LINDIYKNILDEYSKYETIYAKEKKKIANKTFKLLPKEKEKFIKVVSQLLDIDNSKIFRLMTIWIKKKELYDFDLLAIYEKWLYNYVNSWGRCDIFCYHVLNPMFERNEEVFDNIKKWINSEKIYVRRAGVVTLIESTRSFVVNTDLDKVYYIVEALKDDSHLHIQKAIGWLLKYAYLTYPEEIKSYLKKNVNTLSRTTFRYGLEKMPKDVKNELMKL